MEAEHRKDLTALVCNELSVNIYSFLVQERSLTVLSGVFLRKPTEGTRV